MDRRALAWRLAIVVGAALAAFAAALAGRFVNWDDGWLIERNPYIRGFGRMGEVWNPLGDRFLLGAEYLPLRDLSNAVDFALFGLDPAGYRLGNWLLHGLAAGLAFAFLLEALPDPRAAFAAALLWAVHPLHAEVVAWASARKDLLNAVFALLAATLHLRAGRTGSRATSLAAVAAFLLATLSKSSAAGLPVALALWEALRGDPSVPLGRRIGAALLRAAPLLAVAAAGAALHAHHQAEVRAKADWRGGSFLANAFLMAGVHLRYLGQAILPAGLAADYALDEGRPEAAVNLLGIAVAGAALGGAVLAARRRSPVALAALLWGALLLPASNLLVPITNVSADRYLHLPLLGMAVLGGLGWARLRDAGPRAARAAVALLAGAAILFGGAAAVQARTWRDGVSLWTRATERSPRSGRAWQNLGEALDAAGRPDEALAAFRRMIEVEPNNPSLWVHAGNRLWQIGGRGRAAEVEAILRSAVEKAEPGMGGAHVALGWVLNETGRGREAVAMLEEAVRRQPDLGIAHFNLGLWHLSEGRWFRAAEELEESLRLGLGLPDEIEAHGRLHALYTRVNDPVRARHHREERERKRALGRGE